MLATYSRLKGLSTRLPALHAVNLIIALPTVLSTALPVLLSYVVFLLPALNSATALSYFCMLFNLLRISLKSSRSHRRRLHAQGAVTETKVVPVGTIGTHASYRVATAGTSTASVAAGAERSFRAAGTNVIHTLPQTLQPGTDDLLVQPPVLDRH